MTRRQMLTIILINAAVSLLIAVGVVLAAFNLGLRQALAPPTPYVIVPPTATPLPRPTPGRPPSPTPTVMTELYTVQPGDTLLGIAVNLKIDPQLLLDLNDLDDADRLLAGQQLRVPLGSAPPATPAATALPPPTPAAAATAATIARPSPTPALPQAATVISATAVVTNPVLVDVLSPGVLATEAVVIANRGREPLQLRNWSLQSPDGRRYVFPPFNLAPGAVVSVHTGPGGDDQGNLHWFQVQPAWQPPATVILADPAGLQVATLSIE